MRGRDARDTRRTDQAGIRVGDRARPEMADGEDAPLSGRHVERGVASESALPDLDERVDDEPSPLRMIL